MLPTTRSTLFPYTTLFRSVQHELAVFLMAPGPLGGSVFEPQRLLRPPRPPLPRRRLLRPLLERAHCREILVERSEEHTSELQSRRDLVCRLLLEKKNLA